MTDTPTPPLTTQIVEDPFVQHLLRLRQEPRARAELRRGDTTALADRAIPYLGNRFLNGDRWLSAGLLFGAAISRYTNIADEPSQPFARAAFRTLTPLDQRDPAGTSVGRRVVAAQRQTLSLAHRTFSGLLISIGNNAARPALDWTGLWRTYKNWDSTDLDRQRHFRRQLLLDFYGTAPQRDKNSDAIESETKE